MSASSEVTSPERTSAGARCGAGGAPARRRAVWRRIANARHWAEWLGAALLVSLTSHAAACGAAEVENSSDFLLRTDELEVSQASTRFLDAVHAQLQQSGALDEGYPALGDVVAEPGAADPAVESLHCSLDRPEGDGRRACILLDDAGDFIWVQPIVWESAALHVYRLYVAPESMFARVDRNTDFVGLTVFIRNDLSLWEVVDRAIRGAAAEMGARPFRP